MRSFLKEIEDKFLELEDYCDSCDRVMSQCVCNEELDEMSATGAVAGFSTPAAFAKPGKWKSKDIKYESVNTPPSFKWKETGQQKPESDEEVFNDKFPFATDEKYWWQNDNNEYPTRFYKDGLGTNNIKDTSTRVGNLPNSATPIRKTKNEYTKVHDVLDKKYEELIESYRSYATGDSKTSPEAKIKNTIKEVAKKLQEIEQSINYASKLKMESGVARSGYGISVENALNKISNKLIKISERVRSLGE